MIAFAAIVGPPLLIGVLLALAQWHSVASLPMLIRAAVLLALAGTAVGTLQAAVICGQSPLTMLFDGSTVCVSSTNPAREVQGAMVLLAIALSALAYTGVRFFGVIRGKKAK